MHRPGGEQGREIVAEPLDVDCFHLVALDRAPALVAGSDDSADLASRARRGGRELEVVGFEPGGAEAGEQSLVPFGMGELGDEQPQLVGEVAGIGLPCNRKGILADLERQGHAPAGEQPLEALEVEPRKTGGTDQAAEPGK